ncbi:MAG: response regulator [Thermoplasmatota archaeon]
MAMEYSPNSDSKVLIVDDEEGIRSILRRVLLRSGVPTHNIQEAASAEEAQEILERDPTFHLVLSDYRMGVKSGIDLLSWLYRQKPTTLRVLMTGYNEETIAIDAINAARVDAYVKKPWDNARLAELVQDLLRERRSRVARDEALKSALSLTAKSKGSDKGTIKRI